MSSNIGINHERKDEVNWRYRTYFCKKFQGQRII